jgi:hypothetical protein
VHEGDDRTAEPSAAAVDRLRDAVGGRTDALRARTGIDLTIVDALLRVGADRAAVEAISDYQRALRAYAADVDRAVAGAAAEAEAEAVIATILADGGLDLAAPASAASAPPAASVDAGDEPDAAGPRAAPPRSRPVRRALVGALTAAVVLGAALATPGLRPSPQAGLAAAELEAREELAVARERLSALQAAPSAAATVTAEARELHDRIFALSSTALEREVVREQIRELLDLEQVALEEVAPDEPLALELIEEIRAIRTSLDLDLPLPARPEVPPLDLPDVDARPDPGALDLPAPADGPLPPPGLPLPEAAPGMPGAVPPAP